MGKSRHFSEDAVASFLSSQHYVILDRNIVFPGGEVDIVAEKKQQLVFIEVKYRKYFDAAEAFDLRKFQRIWNCAYLYTRGERSFRVDLFACGPKETFWYKGVREDGCCDSMERVNLW
ncbi:YraN family protein [Coprothermobacter platensis]|uniref:YraN family protein n=1 Tax=Coprothermobacter platensis TaxID=108819 RepID=UPI000377D1E0|nr:YraN family protein [Coprothermobacter platensis]